jgi:hypothetical protein
MAKDFKSDQVRVNKIIGSGTSPGILIYSSSDATDYDGTYQADMLTSVGRDVFLFVSGSRGSFGAAAGGSVLFGGDVIISGSIYDGDGVLIRSGVVGAVPAGLDTQFQFNDSGSFGGAADLTYVDLTGDTTIGTTTGIAKLFFRDTGIYLYSKADGELDIVSDTKLGITGSGTSPAAIAIKTSDASGGIDIDAGSGGITIDAAGVFGLNSTNQINLGTSNSGIPIAIGHATSEVTIGDNLTVVGNLTVNGTTTAIDTDNLRIKDPLIYVGSGALVANSNGGFAIASGSSVTGQALVIGRIADDTWGVGKLDVESGEKAGGDVSGMDLVSFRTQRLELGTTGGTLTFITQSDGSRVNIVSPLLELGATDGSTILAVTASEVRIGNISAAYSSNLPPSPGLDTFLFISGALGSKNTNSKGTTVFGGDVAISGTLHGGSPLKVSGSINLSGSLKLQTQDTAPDVGSNESVIYTLVDGAGTKLFFKNGDGTQIQIKPVSGTFNEAAGGYFVTEQFTSFAGNQGAEHSPQASGIDVFFYVSGSAGSRGSEFGGNAGTALFGGDVVVSGTIYDGLGNSYSTAGGPGGDSFFSSTVAGSVITTGSVAFVGDNVSITSPQDVGTDVFFFVSGTTAGGGGSNSVIGGNLIVSGTYRGGYSSFLGQEAYIADSPFFLFKKATSGQMAIGSDVYMLVSGAVGSKDGATRGAALFIGDVVVSGTIYDGSGNSYSTAGGPGGDSFFSSTTAGSVFTTGSLALRGNNAAIDSPSDIGSDVFFFVSGSSEMGNASATVIDGTLVLSGNVRGGVSPLTMQKALSFDSDMFLFISSQVPVAGLGQDTYMYVSGAIGTKGQVGGTVAIFGGDVFVSGNSYIETIGTIPGGVALYGDTDGRIVFSSSDQRVKKNIETVTGSLDAVMNLTGVYYYAIDDDPTPENRQIGLIAQNVQSQIPELAVTYKSGIMGVRYEKTVAILIEAIKEQQGMIQSLEDRIRNLEGS